VKKPAKTRRGVPNRRPATRRSRRWAFTIALVLLLLALGGSYLLGDWWIGLPAESTAQYVGRNTCAKCHANETRLWQGSHHDLAMDLATPDTVLADFDDAQLEHFGITSRMYREGSKYLVDTEGPEGEMQTFEVKYVLGVTPLQQYMVELDRPADMPPDEISRVQVLRLSWDTERNRWFYLSPPDVNEKLSPKDPLHWTGQGQNWNHMCAVCHSTHLRKGFDVATATYHTEFSEIDVSCEACHGPGSLHVELAEATSPFWDRKLGYGLRRLKGDDHRLQIESCAPCHSRRRIVFDGDPLHDRFYDGHQNEILTPQTYHADGQILDEVYVYGSFIQSKMYQKGIRCTDCHDAHTTKIHKSDNTLCTSCHQHTPAKYDTPAHHNHPAGSTGTLCVECHMPATPYMDVDFRRDHSMRIPRPDLSVKLKTPNACTGCHLDADNVSPEKRPQLDHYSKWLAAARDGDEQVAAEIARVDAWSAEWIAKWYRPKDPPLHWAGALTAAWNDDPTAESQLLEIADSREIPAIARASAFRELQTLGSQAGRDLAKRALRDRDAQVRVAALACLEELPREELLRHVPRLLKDSTRLVRMEAARTLAGVPLLAFEPEYQQLQRQALDEYRAGLLVNADQAGSHVALGVLAERMQRPHEAARAYQLAIHVQPDVAGPRSNLAAILERLGQTEQVPRLRADELKLLRRDAELAPDFASVQYRYGLSLYLNGQFPAAVQALQKACLLEPQNADYQVAMALLYERLERRQDALRHLRAARSQRPNDPSLQQLQLRLSSQRDR
jgi:tetratricopeptide (TPR) repeat protein/Zn finger protein HypA/HybF involved in hydrogenase expression